MRDEYYLTMREAAAAADVSYSTVKRYVAAGVLWPKKVKREDATGHYYLFSDRDVQRARETYGHNVTFLRIGLLEHLKRRKDYPLTDRALREGRQRENYIFEVGPCDTAGGR